MRKLVLTVGFVVLVLALARSSSSARDAAGDLRRMIGYTIIDAATVREVADAKYGGKLVSLDNGDVYKVALLLLEPLPMTDVIIFAKKLTKPEVDLYRKKFPNFPEIMIRVLIDNEAYDAVFVSKK
jgi:hypothetical protein